MWAGPPHPTPSRSRHHRRTPVCFHFPACTFHESHSPVGDFIVKLLLYLQDILPGYIIFPVCCLCPQSLQRGPICRCIPLTRHSHRCRLWCQILPSRQVHSASSAAEKDVSSKYCWLSTQSIRDDCHQQTPARALHLQDILTPIADDAKVLCRCNGHSALFEGREFDSVAIECCSEGSHAPD